MTVPSVSLLTLRRIVGLNEGRSDLAQAASGAYGLARVEHEPYRAWLTLDREPPPRGSDPVPAMVSAIREAGDDFRTSDADQKEGR